MSRSNFVDRVADMTDNLLAQAASGVVEQYLAGVLTKQDVRARFDIIRVEAAKRVEKRQ